ncbi:MAG: nitronate monooxygenase [Candidatus Binatia bacterium]
MAVDLKTSVCGFNLRHPVMLGSGPLGVRADQLLKFGHVASAVITKSISLQPSVGSPQPRIARINHEGMLNYEGGPNPGIEEFSRIIKQVKPDMECPLIGSLSPRTLRLTTGMEELAARFEEAGADAIELDFKYLYDQKQFRTDFQLRQISGVLTRLRQAVRIPLIAKLAHGVTDITDLAKTAEDAGASAISGINTVFPAMKISLRRRAPILSMKYGGLSGAPIRPLAVASVFRIASAVQVPVIGIGGIMTGEDVLEFLLAGACAVQIFTVAMVKEEKAFTQIVGELQSCMEQHHIPSVRESVGVAQTAVVTGRTDEQWTSFFKAEP